MNHHSFRQVIKDIPATVLKHQGFNPAHFKVVCYTLSMYGDYEKGKSIYPSWLTIAKESGVNRKTAMKVRDFLINYGLLVEVKKREKNIAEYYFGEPNEQLSILIDQLSILIDQLSINSGHNTIIDTISNTTNPQEEKEEKEIKVKSSLGNIIYCADETPIERQLSISNRLRLEKEMNRWMVFDKV